MNRNSIVRAIVSSTAAAAILSVAAVAFARPPYVGVIKKVYPKDTLNCQSCHDGAPPKLNKYGEAVKGQLVAAKTKTLTEAMIKALDKKGTKPVKGGDTAPAG